MNKSNDPPTFWERPTTVRAVIGFIVVSCILLVLAEFAYHHHHPHFALEASYAFQAWLGFLAFVVAVFAGRALRWAVERRRDYYDANPDETRSDIDPALLANADQDRSSPTSSTGAEALK